jgi:hypothetical protein
MGNRLIATSAVIGLALINSSPVLARDALPQITIQWPGNVLSIGPHGFYWGRLPDSPNTPPPPSPKAPRSTMRIPPPAVQPPLPDGPPMAQQPAPLLPRFAEPAPPPGSTTGTIGSRSPVQAAMKKRGAQRGLSSCAGWSMVPANHIEVAASSSSSSSSSQLLVMIQDRA